MLSLDNIMKSKEVLRLLRISRPTLYRYKEQGILDASKLPNGQYNFDERTVYSFLNKDIPRKNYLYARVSKYKQKKDLENQIELLKSWCFR